MEKANKSIDGERGNIMYDSKLEHETLKTAIILARMYGIRETLEPLPRMPNKEMVDLIIKWTEEYFDTEQEDIVRFFEYKSG